MKSLEECFCELDLLKSYLHGVFIPMKAAQLFKCTSPAHHKYAYNGEGMKIYLFNDQIPTFEEYKKTPFWINSKSYLGMEINSVK